MVIAWLSHGYRNYRMVIAWLSHRLSQVIAGYRIGYRRLLQGIAGYCRLLQGTAGYPSNLLAREYPLRFAD